MTKSITGLFLTAIMLSACTGDGAEPEASLTPPPEPVTADAVAPPEPEPAAPPPPRMTMGDVMGQTPVWLQAEFGPPTLVRRDGRLQVVLYESDRCILDFTLEEASEDDYFRVVHAAARDRSGNSVDMTVCLDIWLGDPQ